MALDRWAAWMGAGMVGTLSLGGAALAGAAVAKERTPAPVVVLSPPRQLTAAEATYLDEIADTAGPLRLMRPYEVVDNGHAICADLTAGRDAPALAARRDQLPARLATVAVESAKRHLCR